MIILNEKKKNNFTCNFLNFDTIGNFSKKKKRIKRYKQVLLNEYDDLFPSTLYSLYKRNRTIIENRQYQFWMGILLCPSPKTESAYNDDKSDEDADAYRDNDHVLR